MERKGASGPLRVESSFQMGRPRVRVHPPDREKEDPWIQIRTSEERALRAVLDAARIIVSAEEDPQKYPALREALRTYQSAQSTGGKERG